MNASCRHNKTYLTEAEWYELYGSTWLIDSICFFVLFPLSTIGIFLNLINYLVLSNKKFKVNPIFLYLKYYSFNSSIINFVCALLVIKTCKTYFYIFNNTIITQVIICYFYIPFVNMFVFLSATLDIAITLERNSQFFKSKNISISKSIHIVLVLLFVSILINVQYFFIAYPTSVYLNVNATAKIRIYTFSTTEFSSSFTGIILNSMGLIFRDVILLIVQLALSIKTIFLLRRHFTSKQNSMFPFNGNYKLVNTTALVHSIGNRISKANKNFSVMVTIMGLLTCFEHISLLIGYAYITFVEYSFLVFLFSALIISFKHFSNFILFYKFNHLFRTELKTLFKIQSENSFII